MTSSKESFLNHLRAEWYRPDLVRYVPEALPTSVLAALASEQSSQEVPLGLIGPTSIVQYYLILNSINHQFWSLDEQGQMVRYIHDGNVGALALRAGIDRLIAERGLDMEEPLTVQDVAHYFGAIPEPHVRCSILNQAFFKSGVLAHALVADMEEGWTVMEALNIAQTLPLGYTDEALKKAQLALYMASQSLRSIGIEVPVEFTVFADYQVPKVMRHLGQLEFSPELAAKIDAGQLLDADSVEERAIRAATILCGEDTSARSGVPTGQLDFWYWQQRNDTALPFHRTLTVAY